jgi:hypothetical protein
LENNLNEKVPRVAIKPNILPAPIESVEDYEPKASISEDASRAPEIEGCIAQL